MEALYFKRVWIISINKNNACFGEYFMNATEMELKVNKALNDLEESGDIVITTTTPSVITRKVVEAIGYNVQNLLNDEEYRAVLNSLNVLAHDVKLDNNDFQTIIGIERSSLKTVYDKLATTCPVQTSN